MSQRMTKVRDLTEKMARLSEHNNSRIKALEKGQREEEALHPQTYNPSPEEVMNQVKSFADEAAKIQLLYVEIMSLDPDPPQGPSINRHDELV